MNKNPLPHRRRSIRLKEYDYSQPGAYFITICTHHKIHLFADAPNGEIILNQYGKIVEYTWRILPKRISGIELNSYVIMPNHFHGILSIVDEPVGAGASTQSPSNRSYAPAPTPDTKDCLVKKQTPLPEIIRHFKTCSAIGINRLRGTTGKPVWQRGYYEHIIRDEIEFNNFASYIVNNPLKWELDKYFQDSDKATNHG